jgi:hypothetical protein
MDLSRREILSTAAVIALSAREASTREPKTREPKTREPGTAEPATAEPATALPETFPRQASAMVQEMVVVSHGNARRVRELVEAHPALARAAIDWGFGDWEDALGAASHMGNREIAEYLVANGARPTIFSAAMLGQLDVVKAFVGAQPGVQRIAGPHSISLLSHAKAGGPAAVAVYDYLDRIGDAGGPATSPISDEQKATLAGRYEFDITISIEKSMVMFDRKGMPYARGLYHVRDREFFPMGASAVRIAFDGAKLTVRDGDLVVTAAKIA